MSRQTKPEFEGSGIVRIVRIVGMGRIDISGKKIFPRPRRGLSRCLDNMRTNRPLSALIFGCYPHRIRILIPCKDNKFL